MNHFIPIFRSKMNVAVLLALGSRGDQPSIDKLHHQDHLRERFIAFVQAGAPHHGRHGRRK